MSNPRPFSKTVSRRKKRTRQPKHQTGIVHRSMSGIEPKYYDVLSLANNIGAGATLFLLSTIAQGTGQSQRTGDFVRVLRIIHNFNLYCFNSDICTTTRLIFFQWIPSTASFVPLVASILEAPASSNVYSHLNFQIQSNYRVLKDTSYRQAGTATAPTDTSVMGLTGESIPIGPNPEIEFGLGVTSGTCHYFVLAISDSVVAPFPQYSFSIRIYYEDVERASPHRMVK